MPTSFNNNYTELSAINGGNQLQNGDSVLAEHVNGALQNTAHFKELTDNKVIRRAYLQNNKLVLELATKNNESAVSVVSFEVSNNSLNAVDKVISFGGWTATINNNGNSILFKIDGSEYGYEFNIGRDELTYCQYVGYQYATFMMVQTYVECFPEECIKDLVPYAWVLKYDGGNIKMILLRMMTMLLGYRLTCKIIYSAFSSHRESK